jgi:hypothetical protein
MLPFHKKSKLQAILNQNKYIIFQVFNFNYLPSKLAENRKKLVNRKMWEKKITFIRWVERLELFDQVTLTYLKTDHFAHRKFEKDIVWIQKDSLNHRLVK